MATAAAAEQVNSFVEATRESIEHAYTTAVDRAQAKLDELNRKQEEHRQVIEKNGQAIEALSQKMQGASEAEQANIEQEIAKLKQLNQEREKATLLIEQQKTKVEEKGLVALGGTQAEIALLREANVAHNAMLGTLSDQVRAQNAVKDATQQQIASAVAGIHAVVDQQRIHQQAIDLDKVKLGELMEKRLQASGAEAKQLDQEIASLTKSMQQQKEQMQLLDLKRVKLEENLAITVATSDKEVAAAQTQSQANQAETQSLMDVTRAQNAVTGAVDSSTDSVGRLLTQFGGLIGVTSIVAGIAMAFKTLEQVLQADIDKAIALNKAMNDLTQRQMTAQQKLDAGFTEGGVTDEASKRQIQGLLFGDNNNASIPKQYGSNEDQTAQAYESIAPVLKQHHIGPDDPRFTQLIGTASLFVKEKMDPTLIRNVTSDVLARDDKAGGSDLNTSLTQLSDVAGSPQYANSLGQAIYEHRRQAELGGLEDDDLKKFWQVGRSHGLSPEETGEAVGGLETSSRRFVGKDYQQRVALLEQLSGVLLNPQNKLHIDMMKRWQPQKVLEYEEGLSHVSPTIKRWLNGKATVKEVMEDMSTLSPQDLALVSTQVGGGRLSPNAAALLPGWTTQQLPQGSFTPPLTTPEQQIQAKSDQDKNIANLSQPLSITGGSFETVSENTKAYFEQHRDMYPTGYDPEGFGQKGPQGAGVTSAYLHGRTNLTPEMIRRSYALGMDYLSAAKLLDDPRIPATEKDAIRVKMQTLLPYMGWGDDEKNYGGYQDWTDLSGTDAGARASILSKLSDNDPAKQQDLRMNYLHGKLNDLEGDIPPDIMNNKSLGGSLDEIDRVRSKYTQTPQGPPAPTTRPTTQPVSINYNRNTIYSYSLDSIGSVNTNANLFG